MTSEPVAGAVIVAFCVAIAAQDAWVGAVAGAVLIWATLLVMAVIERLEVGRNRRAAVELREVLAQLTMVHRKDGE